MATTVKGREIRSAGTKTVWDNGMGLRLTHNKIGDFGAVSETQGGCASPILKVDRHIPDRFPYVRV